MTVNLILGDNRAISEALLRIRRVFDNETLLLADADHDNLLVLAFASAAPEMPSAQQLNDLGLRWGIDFASLARRLTRLAPPASA